MKVLFATPYFAPAFMFGGIPRASWDLALGLAREGVEVHVVTSDAFTLTQRWPGPLGVWEDLSGIKVMRLRGLNWDITERLGVFVPFHLPTVFAGTMPDVDLIHIHGCRHVLGHFVDALYGGRKPLVITPHGSGGVIESKQGLKQVYDHLVGHRFLRRAKRVITVAEIEHEPVRARGVDPLRVRNIPNPVDRTPLLRPRVRGRFRAKWGLSPTKPLILFMHKITPRKNLDVFIDAVAYLMADRGLETRGEAPFEICIAGAALMGFSAYQAQIDRLGLARRVLLTGHLDGDDKWDAFTDADVLAFPAEQEVFGLAAFESILCGTPVAAAGDFGMAEWLKRTGAGRFVMPRDPLALANLLRSMLGAGKVAASELDSARDKAAQWFDPRQVARETIRVYEEALR
jgi:glycosyltransferase involved in cell wall biosynthesis